MEIYHTDGGVLATIMHEFSNPIIVLSFLLLFVFLMIVMSVFGIIFFKRYKDLTIENEETKEGFLKASLQNQKLLYKAMVLKQERNRWNYDLIEHSMPSIKRYIEEGVEPGGFLKAVINNDLGYACSQADDINLWLIPVYATWLYNEAPSSSHGYNNAVRDWRDHIKFNKTQESLID